MDIILVDNQISKRQLEEMAQQQFGDMVKAVVDVKKGIMAIGGGLHYEEAFLLDRSSEQEDL